MAPATEHVARGSTSARYTLPSIVTLIYPRFSERLANATCSSAHSSGSPALSFRGFFRCFMGTVLLLTTLGFSFLSCLRSPSGFPSNYPFLRVTCSAAGSSLVPFSTPCQRPVGATPTERSKQTFFFPLPPPFTRAVLPLLNIALPASSLDPVAISPTSALPLGSPDQSKGGSVCSLSPLSAELSRYLLRCHTTRFLSTERR